MNSTLAEVQISFEQCVRCNTTRSPWLAVHHFPHLINGKLSDFPHGHDDVIVALEDLADLHTHQRVQAQVS